MSNTQVNGSLREQARKCREQKEVQERERRTEQELLNRCRGAIEALRPSVYGMRCSPPTEAELEQHYSKVVPLLAEALAALREGNLLSKLEQLDEPATLAHYRQQGNDPQEIQIAFAHAKQIIEADPADRFGLKELVRDAVEEPGLRRAWDWLFILLCGLTRQQKVVWRSDRDWPNPPPSLTSEVHHKRGRKPLTECAERERRELITAWERFRGSRSGTKKDFCQDRKIELKKLNNILAWQRTRRNRLEVSRGVAN